MTVPDGRFEPKRVNEVKEYAFDWRAKLALVGDAISSFVITPETGITISGDTTAGGYVWFTASGGSAGRTYEIVCDVTTTGGETLRDKGFLQVRAL